MEIVRLKPYQSKNIWHQRQRTLSGFLDNRLVIMTTANVHMIDLDNIVYIAAEGNYSRILLYDGKRILSSKTLKYYELQLINKGFLRVHSGYLVNLEKVKGIRRGSEFGMSLDNDEIIPISRAFKAELFTGSFHTNKVFSINKINIS